MLKVPGCEIELIKYLVHFTLSGTYQQMTTYSCNDCFDKFLLKQNVLFA